MSSALTAALILMSEIGAVLTVFFIVWAVLAFLRYRRERRYGAAFIATYQEHAAQRKQQITEWLQQYYAQDESNAADTTQALFSHEKRLYGRIVQTYLRRDHEAINALDADIQRLIQAYQSLGGAACDPAANPAELTQLQSRIEELEQANTALQKDKEHLQIDLNIARQSLEDATQQTPTETASLEEPEPSEPVAELEPEDLVESLVEESLSSTLEPTADAAEYIDEIGTVGESAAIPGADAIEVGGQTRTQAAEVAGIEVGGSPAPKIDVDLESTVEGGSAAPSAHGPQGVDLIETEPPSLGEQRVTLEAGATPQLGEQRVSLDEGDVPAERPSDADLGSAVDLSEAQETPAPAEQADDEDASAREALMDDDIDSLLEKAAQERERKPESET